MPEITLKPTQVAIFARTLWCYCEILLVFAKYKSFWAVTPRLIFYIFKVKYIEVVTARYNLLRLVTCNRLVNLGISKEQHLYLKTKNLI